MSEHLSYPRKRHAALRIGVAAAVLFAAWSFYYMWVFFTPIPITDGWPLLHRIMEAKQGRIGWDGYFFRIHGAHLHFIIYALGLLDYAWLGGQQKLQAFVSALAVAATAGLLCWIIARQALLHQRGPWLTALSILAVAALILSLQDFETLLIPFQAVLTVSRLVYVGLLWLLAYALCTGRRDLYPWLMGLSIFSTCFHGSGHLFALCVIFLHLLLREPWKRVGLSLLPLCFSLTLQKIYTRGISEMNMIGKAMEWQSVPELLYGIFAYFASPLCVLYAKLHVDPVYLLPVGFAVFSCTAWLLLRTLLQEFQAGGLLRPRDSKAEPLPRLSTTHAFFTVLMLLVLLSAASGSLIWVIRTHLPGFTEYPTYEYVISSSRYACFGLLGYIGIIYAMLGWNGPFTRAATWVTVTVFLTMAIVTSAMVIRTHTLARDLNIGAAAILSGLPLFGPKTDIIWPGAADDAHWKTELPVLFDYLEKQGRGMWYHLPALGTALPAGNPLHDVTEAGAAIGGICHVNARGNTGGSHFLLAITEAGRVIGYAAPLRETADGLSLEGFIPCNKMSAPLTAVAF